MGIFDPYYSRVILETPAGVLMVGLFLADLFLIIESFTRKRLWHADGRGLRKRLIVLKTSVALLLLLGVAASCQRLRTGIFDACVERFGIDPATVVNAAWEALIVSQAALWMGIIVLICLAILEITAERAKAAG